MKDAAEDAMFLRRAIHRRYAEAQRHMTARGLETLVVTGLDGGLSMDGQTQRVLAFFDEEVLPTEELGMRLGVLDDTVD
jgi:hypothetical protein